MRVPMLTQALEIGLQLNEGVRDNSVLHVTDLSHTIPGEGCPRQLWLKFKGADKRGLTAGEMLMFRNSHRIHEDLTYLLKAGLPREWEIIAVELPMEFCGVVGTCDAVMHNIDTRNIIVVDYKTSRGKNFGFIKAQNKPKAAHTLQVQTYGYGLDVSGQCDAEGALVFYVDREGQNASLQFPVTRNDSAVPEAITLAEEIIAGGEPPILDAVLVTTTNKGPDSVRINLQWPCNYCHYRDISCKPALLYDWRKLGIVARIDNGKLIPAKDIPKKVIDMVDRLLYNDSIPF